MRKIKSSAKSKSGIKQILCGALTVWAMFFILSFVFSVILFSGDDPTGSTALFSMIAFILSGGIGTLVNRKIFSRCDKNIPLISSLVCALAYAVISIIASGKLSLGSLITALCFLGASALASITKKKKAKRHAH